MDELKHVHTIFDQILY